MSSASSCPGRSRRTIRSTRWSFTAGGPGPRASCRAITTASILHPGLLGDAVTVEAGAEAARWCALNALSVLQAELGDLDRIERVLTVIGVRRERDRASSTSPTSSTARAALLHDVFGDAGRHSRSAVGVAALPRGGAVEIEVEVALR